MIDKLFGSKTRVKLLHLFLNNPDDAYYVREITRLIDEQINSVRRELANMLAVGIIGSDTADNKLYYRVNQRYEHYLALRQIFGDTKHDPISITPVSVEVSGLEGKISSLSGLRVAVVSGVLVGESKSSVDLLLAGDLSTARVKSLVKNIEASEGRDINYSVLSYDDFYYRLSVRDRFVIDVLSNKHKVIVDTDNVLKG